MENTSLDLLINTGKTQGYLDARVELRTFLNEIQESKLMTNQLKTYILDGMEAKWNVYHNKLANDGK